jgi:ankyrin repeat protein
MNNKYSTSISNTEYLTWKAKLEANTNKGWNPIHIACYYGYTDVVQSLIDIIDLEEENVNYQRAIHLACLRDNVCFIENMISLNCVKINEQFIETCVKLNSIEILRLIN